MSAPVSKVDRLRVDAHEAAAVRALTTHPDVIALRTERVRAQVDALIWAGMLLGLAFTMVNVQTFAAAGAVLYSLAWIAAWLLDPMVSLVLIAVLRAEQVTARYQVKTGPWVRRTKKFAFAATYTMNTWASWTALHLSGIVLHSVPPVLVYMAAEVGPILRDRLTEAVIRAADLVSPTGRNPVHDTTTPADTEPTAGGVPATVTNPTSDTAVNDPTPIQQPATPPVREPAREPARAARKNSRRKTAVKPRRVLYPDYLATARAALTADIMPTAKWCQEVTGCSAGTSVRLSRELRDEIAHQDIPAKIERVA
jgi:hypothetical protein